MTSWPSLTNRTSARLCMSAPGCERYMSITKPRAYLLESDGSDASQLVPCKGQTCCQVSGVTQQLQALLPPGAVPCIHVTFNHTTVLHHPLQYNSGQATGVQGFSTMCKSPCSTPMRRCKRLWRDDNRCTPLSCWRASKEWAN